MTQALTDEDGVTYDMTGVAPTETGPICGSCGRHHANVASVRACYDLEEMFRQQVEDDAAAERAYERHLEDSGYWDAQAQDDYEAAHGILSFTEAWDLESPGTRAGYGETR